MWLDNLKEMKKKSGMTSQQISDKSRIPLRTINRIFAGESDHPYADTLDLIVKAMGDYDLGDLFSDTNVVIATESIVEVKEVVEELEAEQDTLLSDNQALRDELIAKEAELQALRDELARRESQHKDELIELVKYFTKIKSQ